jgi:N-acetyltransferase
MTATRPSPATLAGQFIRLEPLTVEALPELYAAIGVPEVFAGGYGGGPAGYRDNLDDFVAWAKSVHRWGDGNPYLVRANGGPLDGVAIGTTTLADFDESREHAHIGWTAYDPRVWGTQVNPEAKLLLLGLAFDSGFGRVKIQGDELNERSRAAILKLGATFEGIVRRDMLRADGTWRNTAVFSILIDEWPDVRAGLEKRLAAWAGRFVEYRDR